MKIEENPQWLFSGWENGEREKFVIWSSTSACQTLEEICICNSYVCASKELFQKGPMRPLAMLHFAQLKSLRIEMNAKFWEEQMSTICYIFDDPLALWERRTLPPRFSLIDNAPNLENLSITYHFNQTRSMRSVSNRSSSGFVFSHSVYFDLFEEASSKQKLQLIIVYLGNDSLSLADQTNFLY